MRVANAITRRGFLGTALVPLPALSQGRARPNVVIVMTDDQGYGDLSCHGNPVLRTPAMDRMHAESIRFTDFHSAPMCTPTRGQLLTGLDALHNGATSVTAGRAIVRRGIPMMPELFRASGYATGVFGKWHVGDTYPYRPMDRGFDVAKYHHGFGISSAVELGNDYANGRYQDNGVTKKFDGYCTISGSPKRCDSWEIARDGSSSSSVTCRRTLRMDLHGWTASTPNRIPGSGHRRRISSG